MRKFFILTILLATYIVATASPKYEMRAVWLTTNWGLDWPSAPASNMREIAHQQAEMCTILDEVASLGFNTVFFQTRTKGEVFYDSEIEPWSPIVSGKAGQSPGYDPLTFVIEECHRRGLECHAWLISIPVGSVRQAQRHGKNSVPSRHPQLCIKLKNEWYLDPGHPQTAQYLASIATEIARNYNIDGIHLDYIRYPGEYGNFPDSHTYATYGNQMPISEWRMNNISNIVRTISSSVKEIDNTIMISSAPLGRYEIIKDLPSSDWVCMGSAFQDALQWLADGDNDFIAPMMYYPHLNYFPYLFDWVQRIGHNGYIIAGLGAYRLEKNEGNWSLTELQHQIEATRHYGAGGQSFFRMQHLHEFSDLAHLLAGHYYRYPALIPPMRRINTPTLPAVANLQLYPSHYGDTLRWNASKGATRYAVYASVTDSVDISDPTQLLQTWVTDTEFVLPPSQYRSFAVTAIDAYRRESNPAHIRQQQKACIFNTFLLF